MKKNTGFAFFIIIVILLVSLSVKYEIWSNESNLKDFSDKGKTEAYIHDVKPVDYTPTFTGFVLEKFTETKTVFLSWWELIFSGKTLTGTIIKAAVQPIKKNEKYFYERTVSPAVTTISGSWINNKQGFVISDKNSTSDGTTKMYELRFVPWFTKMKLLGEEYAFNEQNLSYGNEYDMQLFLADNEAYVMDFENLTEWQQRKKTFLEYKKKIEDVNEKYRWDPHTINKLVDELNKAYDIRIKQLN